MENFNLPEWLKVVLGVTGGLAAWSIAAYMAKKWFEKAVLEEITSLKSDVSHIRDSITDTMKNISTFILRFSGYQNEFTKSLQTETRKMSEMFSSASQQAFVAAQKSEEAIQRANVIQRASEENRATVEKLIKIATAVHDQNKTLRHEVVEIKSELVLIKAKK